MLPGQHLTPESILFSQSYRSLDMCIYICTKMEGCLALSYDHDSTCHIASQRPIVAVDNDDGAIMEFADCSNMTCVLMKGWSWSRFTL